MTGASLCSIARRAKEDAVARRLMTIPGIGAVTATALVSLAPPPESFRRGRDFAAWLGLTPLQQSSGGKERLGRTSKMGERTLRRLLIIGASAVASWVGRNGAPKGFMACAADEPQAHRCWSGWLWPTRWRARSGPCLRRAGSIELRPWQRKSPRPRGPLEESERSNGGYGATVKGRGRKNQVGRAPRARQVEMDPIRRLPYGSAARYAPHQRPYTCQHPTMRCTKPDDFSCSGRGVHRCPSSRAFSRCGCLHQRALQVQRPE